MADDTSEDEYIESEDDNERSSSDGERSGRSTERKSRQTHQAQLRSGEDEPTQQRPISQSRRLLHKSDSLVQPSSRQPSEGQSRSRQSSKVKSCESKRDQSRASQSSQKVDIHTAPDYESILDRMILDVHGHSSDDSHSLDPSQVGASFWTAQEKDAFFRALDTHGLDDTPGISRAVGTKSQYEVFVYLSLLQKGAADQQASSTQTDHYPAALEISEQCEASLETMADDHAVKSYEHDLLPDLAKYGDDFLIDEETADLDEVLYEQQEADADIDEDEVSAADASDSVPKPSSRITAKSEQASLFRLPLLLQLMRNVFMNNGEQEHLNWHHIQPILEDSSEPAIYKSALADLTTIVGNLTRRLVQATIFQAMTRLRAGDSSRSDWTPLAAIREVDVHKAADLLDMKPEWHQYWADVVERNHLAVYSDSKKYQDGRPGKKFGYRLTSEESRKELVGELQETPDHSDHESMDDLEEDIAEFMEDSDLFTDDDAPSHHSSETANNSDSEAGPSRPGSRKRKRALSPKAFAQAEDKSLEVTDQYNSMQEEVRLWSSLGLDPPQELLHRRPHDPEAPRARMEPSQAKSWRDTFEYVDDWELGTGIPRQSDFLAMQSRGEEGRKRRKAIAEAVKSRLGIEARAFSTSEDDDDGDKEMTSPKGIQGSDDRTGQAFSGSDEVEGGEDGTDDGATSVQSTSESSE